MDFVSFTLVSEGTVKHPTSGHLWTFNTGSNTDCFYQQLLNVSEHRRHLRKCVLFVKQQKRVRENDMYY